MKRKLFGLSVVLSSVGLLVLTANFLAKGEVASVKVGDKVPDFTLTRFDGKPFKLSKEVGHGPIVLAFFPAAFSSVCTKQLCNYRDNISGLKRLKAHVFAISGDDVATLKKFHDEDKFTFPLLSDPGGAVAKTFDAWYTNLGKAKRAILILDNKGILRFNEAEAVPVTFKDAKKLVELVGQNAGPLPKTF